MSGISGRDIPISVSSRSSSCASSRKLWRYRVQARNQRISFAVNILSLFLPADGIKALSQIDRGDDAVQKEECCIAAITNSHGFDVSQAWGDSRDWKTPSA